MTARSWAWDRLTSDQRGHLLRRQHLARVAVEIAGTAVVMAVQMAAHAVSDRWEARRG